MRDDEIILDTIHGSRLYGLSKPDSDFDIFRVVRRRRKALVTMRGNVDYREFGLDAFLEYVFNGSHQSCEALFSPVAYIHEQYQPMLSSMRVAGVAAFSAYRRTIKAFSFGDFKKRRHAARLSLNLHDLRSNGRFNPRLTAEQINWVTLTAHEKSGEELFDTLAELH